MNLSELRTFLAIVETGSLVQASLRENVSQSTVTARLKTLEQEMGQILVTRQKSGASLTPAGMRLLRYAETISDLWQQARQETSLPDGVDTVCNLACHPDLWGDLGQHLFDHIRTTQPKTAVSIWTGGQHDIAQWFSGGRVDLALSYWQSGQEARVIAKEQLILVADKPDRPIRFDPGYVFVEHGDDFGRDHAIAFADADTARLSFGSSGLGCQHILNHGGSAYLSERIAAPHLAAERLFILEDAPEFSRDIDLIARTHAVANWQWVTDAMKGAV